MSKNFFCLLLALFVSSACSCGNECSFHKRCRGNILEVCGEGPDHVIGRKIRPFPCEKPNPVCIELPKENAMCVADPVTPCDETFNSFCIDNILYSCAFTSVEKKGYVAGTDCSQIKTYDASASLQCIEDKETGSRCR